MIKQKGINYMLVNSTFFVFLFYLLYKIDILNELLNFMLILFFSLILSYIIYPLHKLLTKKISSVISIIFIYIFLFLMIVLFLYSIRPNADLINNIVDLFSNILKFIDKVNIKYNLNIDLDVYVEKIINYFINNSFFLIKNVINYLSKIIFIVILSICILLNIDYLIMIINKTKHKQLLFNINEKLKKYLIANIKIISVQFVEYTLVFFIVGHPNYLLLGLLNSINSFIPYVGTFVTNVIAITTASVIDQKLLLLTCIISILLPNVDAYIITPRIYKQTNELPQTFCILFVIIFGSLYGIFGILFSIPSLIVVIEILKYKNVVKLE